MRTEIIISKKRAPNNVLKIYEHGINLKRAKCVLPVQKQIGGKRGSITSFSRQAVARLRNAFLTMDVPNSIKIGWTLTLPWADDYFKTADSPALDWFKELLNLFAVSYKRICPKNGYIYRVELQKRGAPHLHLVEFNATFGGTVLGNLFAQSLVKVSTKYGIAFDLVAFISHGVRCDSLLYADNIGYFRYLTDHASKHKREQLGYQGKQWGIVGKSNFVESVSLLSADLNDREYVLFTRYFQRFNRYPVTKFVDGKRVVVKYRRNRRSNGVSFLRGGKGTAARLLALAQANAVCYN